MCLKLYRSRLILTQGETSHQYLKNDISNMGLVTIYSDMWVIFTLLMICKSGEGNGY